MTPEIIKKKNSILNRKFIEVCEKGDFNAATELYNKYYLEHFTTLKNFLSFLKIAPKTIFMLDPHYEEDCALLKSSENKHYNIVKFLLKDNKFLDGIDDEMKTWRFSKILSSAMENNNLEIAQLVLPLIKNKTESFYQTISTSFNAACEKGHLNVIKCILKDKVVNNQKLELFEDEYNTASSHSLILNGFIKACERGQLELIKFLTSGELNYKIDLSKFKKNSEIEIRSEQIMQYLICDYNLDKQYYGSPIIYRDRDKKIYECNEYVNNLFEKRELHKEITSEIINQDDNRASPKRMKV